MIIKTILVALSLEADSKLIADRAIQLANQHDAKLVGVHIIPTLNIFEPIRLSSGDTEDLERIVLEESANKLYSLLKESKNPATITIEKGSPHTSIDALAVSHDAELVVIGSGVPRGVREIAFGSTADRIVRSASRPVLVVRNSALSPYSHIAIGVDFSDNSKAAAAFSAHLAPSASRELIHATAIPLAYKQALLAAGTPQSEIDQYRNAILKRANEVIMEVFGEDGRLPKSASVSVVEGSPAKILLKASRERVTDLLALGTQGADAGAGILLGSITRRVLAESVCDVLVVPLQA